VKRRGNEIVRLGQVATVEDGFAELAGFSLRNANPNVGLSITRSRDASTVTVANKIRAEMEEINKTLPAGTKMEVTQDGGKDAENSLKNVIEALMFGAVLTIFVVYAFLNSWRSTLITALSLPTSVIAAFIAVWACGFTLNFMTLLGLSLAIGVLIDDAIVVRENIVRHMERGEDRVTASAMAPPRSARGDGDHVLHHRGVHSRGLHGRGRRRVVPPVRPHRGDLGAGEPLHLLHPRPDALGLLGRPRATGTRRRRASRGARTLQRLVRPPGRPLRQRDRLGAAPPQVDDGHRGRHFVAAHRAASHRRDSTFLPPPDYGTIAIDVRTPSSASLEYASSRSRRPPSSPRRSRRPWRRTSSSTPEAGASTSTSASAKPRPLDLPRSGASCARS
jgi:hypothetical protein